MLFSVMIVFGLLSTQESSSAEKQGGKSTLNPNAKPFVPKQRGADIVPQRRFNYNDKAPAQSALQQKKFCAAINNELGQHFPPPKRGKTYFCKKNDIQDLDSLKNKLSALTLFSCQKDEKHDPYQRCLVNRNISPIEGCTGPQAAPIHQSKMTNSAIIIYNPERDCIVNAFPPYNQHLNDQCSVDCG